MSDTNFYVLIMIRYIELFGEDCAQRLFRRHLKRLKDEFLSRRERRYLERLPEILQSLFPESLPESQPWEMVVQRIKEHPECSIYFVVAPSGLAPETDWTWGSESSSETNIRENRIPLDLLSMPEAETVRVYTWFSLFVFFFPVSTCPSIRSLVAYVTNGSYLFYDTLLWLWPSPSSTMTSQHHLLSSFNVH